SGPVWDELLARTDLVVCPYDPVHYGIANSPLIFEMIANAIPLVVPGQTALAKSLKEFDSPCETFDAFNSDSVTAAVERAIDRLERHAATALAAAERWARTQGPAAMTAALLAHTVGAPGPVTLGR
ncbi:MAG TPA: hypothetical protein VKU84_09120, partial [Stellaceae bacterium]|nr:hypothetical protein [Stellaceae bacterium]